MTSPSGQSSNSPSPVLPGQLPVPTSVPGNPSPISSLTGGISTPSSSSLEMLLLERAKLLQNQNPVMKAFAELQGKYLYENFTFIFNKLILKFPVVYIFLIKLLFIIL